MSEVRACRRPGAERAAEGPPPAAAWRAAAPLAGFQPSVRERRRRPARGRAAGGVTLHRRPRVRALAGSLPPLALAGAAQRIDRQLPQPSSAHSFEATKKRRSRRGHTSAEGSQAAAAAAPPAAPPPGGGAPPLTGEYGMSPRSPD